MIVFKGDTSPPTNSMRKTHTMNDTADKMNISVELLRALTHPLRMKILEFIDKHKSINVNKIYSTLKLEQSITSQHLKILRATGLVNTHREGKYILYTIDYNKLSNAIRAIDMFFQDSDDEGDDTETRELLN